MESLGDILKRLTPKNISEGTVTSHDKEKSTEVDCVLCGGNGWIRQEVGVGHPNFGKAFPCSCQDQITQSQKIERLQRQSNLGGLARLNFTSLNSTGKSDDHQTQERYVRAYNAAIKYADNPENWVLFTGASGSGKTHFLAAIITRAIENNSQAFYISVPDLLDHLRSTFTPSTDISYDQMFELLRTVPVLALDDLGSHATTPWAQEKLNQILSHRFNSQLPTIIALSVPIRQLDPHLRARLEDKNVVGHVSLGEQSITSTHWQLDRIKSELKSRMTFSNFDTKGNRAERTGQESLQRALNAAKLFSEEPYGWLVFVGPEGSGKTHLAIAVVREIESKGEYVCFAFVPDLLDHLRYTFSPQSSVTYDQLFEDVRTSPYLVLDDLGSHSSTPWAEEKLYQILVYRYEMMLPTVITIRGYIEDLPEAVRSRLMDQRLVELTPIGAPDYRSRGKRPNLRGRNYRQSRTN